jgi:hypothetical protein
MPDGSAFISQEDTELRFETSVHGRKLTAKFDLWKLIYQEKMERGTGRLPWSLPCSSKECELP